MNRTFSIITGLLGIAVLAGAIPARAAQMMHQHGMGASEAAHQGNLTTGHGMKAAQLHGGQVAMSKAHHFETVFAPDGIRLYIYSNQQIPMPVEETTGTATLTFKDGTTKEVPLTKQTPTPKERSVYFCPMNAEVVQMTSGLCPKCGMDLVVQDYLLSKVDLSKVDPASLKARFGLKNMSGNESKAAFTSSFVASDQHAEEPKVQAGDSKKASGSMGHMH